MKICKRLIQNSLMIGAYLTATMVLFERVNLTPESVGGLIGWFGVEVGRIFVGFLLLHEINQRFLNGKN